MKIQIEIPAQGSRIVKLEEKVILFGQPPDIVKGLLRQKIYSFNTLVLTDIREKDGSVLNNLEFPLYYFLFIAKGFVQKRKLNLVGDKTVISQLLRLLRLTLTGPTKLELDIWGTNVSLKNEWLNVSKELALKYASGEMIPVEDFFNIVAFDNNTAILDDFNIQRKSTDCYQVVHSKDSVIIDLNEDQKITPPYPVVSDYVPGGLSKFSLEVLGGASGFSTEEPCTGLAMCFNGNYVLIDSIPFLNQHLQARGISKNQISAVFLTHLHDDHCSMFPLMEMPHKVSIITTQEIYNMAIDKLSCNLGWKQSVISEHFQLIKVSPGETINYYGLNIEVHNTVHSVPTIGATFSTSHKGKYHDVCIVGDNQNLSKINEMVDSGLIPQSTLKNIKRLYTQRFNLLIADGGAGDIHGNPLDALDSKSDRVVFVHVEDIPEVLKATFSMVSSGKRYSLIDGDSTTVTTQIHHFLTQWLGKPLPNAWLYNLLSEQEVHRYNSSDVIIVQGSSTHDSVFLILTGYCEVVQIDEKGRKSIAHLQAGDIIGEMAVLSGTGIRNASVIAKSPVTVCAFAEHTFRFFIQYSGLQQSLEKRWHLRPLIKKIPQFSHLASTVVDRITQVAQLVEMEVAEQFSVDQSLLVILVSGEALAAGKLIDIGDEFGWSPYGTHKSVEIKAKSDCVLLTVRREKFQHLLMTTPQLNYQTRKYSLQKGNSDPDWLLGEVTIN